ncbi:polysaccharide deacetylase family protein [Candidatus Pacearchaeota archaeon]|nr:polysaccharide deacetylase family protein [Candidatus Pacearchaeota archaeon]
MNKQGKFRDVLAFLLIIVVFAMLLIQYSPWKKEIISQQRLGGIQRYVSVDPSELAREYQNFDIPLPQHQNTQETSSSSIVVLNYHGTLAGDTNESYKISYTQFKEHMFALKKAGYQTVTIEQLYSFLRGEQSLPPKSFVITFDDGIKDSYYNTDPILKTLNYTAVMFVITGQSLDKESKYYLNKEELHKMAASGRWDLQSHSYQGHGRIQTGLDSAPGPYLTNKLWISVQQRLETNDEYFNRINSDLQTSKNQLDREFNQSTIGFALPFGEFGQRYTNYPGSDTLLLDAASKAYNMVFYQFKPAINKDFRANFNTENKDFYLVMRISADSIGSASTLLNTVEAAQSLSLPYVETFENSQRWIPVWGKIKVNNDKATITTTSDGSGAMVYLDGSYLWTDYQYFMHLEQNNASRILLTGRFQDSQNYVGCKYVGGFVSVVSVRDKQRTDFDGVRIPIDDFNNSHVGIAIKGNNVGCYWNNAVVVWSEVSNAPPHGGIGLRVEDPTVDANSVVFDSVQAQAI